MSGYSEEWSVTCLCAEIHVFTWQHDLEKILVTEETVTIRVVEIYEFLTIGLSELIYLVVSQEVLNISAVDILLSSPIDPHKPTIWGKIRIGSTKRHPQIFRGNFTLHD